MNNIFKIVTLLILVVMISGCAIFGNGKTSQGSIDQIADLIKEGYGALDNLMWDDWLDETTIITATEEYQKKLNKILEFDKINIRYALVSDKPLNVRVYTDQSKSLEYPACGADIVLKKKHVCEKINKDFLLVITTFGNEAAELEIIANFNTNIGTKEEQTTIAATTVPKEKLEVPPTPIGDDVSEEVPEDSVETSVEEGNTTDTDSSEEDTTETVPPEVVLTESPQEEEIPESLSNASETNTSSEKNVT